jgi:PTH1 family peptidyl-tRNA hydrolase
VAESDKLQLIVGLGNPGASYEATRHNVGFWFVDALASRLGASFRAEKKFQGDVVKAIAGSQDVWLLKPTTYMNLSGHSAQALAHFYKIPTHNILVVHDELDLAPGTARLKRGGGHGGHNGLRDLTQKLGKDFLRLRLGIGHPGEARLVSDYVLSKPSQEDRQHIEDAMYDALDVMDLVMEGELEKAMHQLHTHKKENS